MFRKKIGYLGFIGFTGFNAFKFFSSGNVADLAYIGYFGFFAYFFVAKISGNRMDERYYEDVKTAKSFMGNLALTEIVLMMILGTLIPLVREYMLVLVSACFASLIIAYAIKLYILEERG